MTNSVIFLKKGNSFEYINYDCCENLGKHFQEGSHKIMYVGLPKKEMDSFFMIESNLISYLEFLTNVFDITFKLHDQVKNPVKFTKLDSCSFGKEPDFIYVEVSVENHYTNKYFNTAYNCLRYLWYQHYTNMAIIATNLYNTKIITDNIDILAMAMSYQTTTGRAVLPLETFSLPGLLFFRPKEDIIKHLLKGDMFNNVFYKFPIYFDPEVTMKGSFFSEATSIIKAKDVIGKFLGLMDTEDLPSFMRNNLKAIYDDYLQMKELYLRIIKTIENKNCVMSRDKAILLKKETKTLYIPVISPTGSSSKLSFQANTAVPFEEKKTEKVELPF